LCSDKFFGIVVADLQNLAATAGGYYEHSNQMHPNSGPNYGQGHHNGHPGYYTPHQQSSYAPVYYPVTHGADIGQHASYDNRKRGYDALNDFFGDAKRRQIDPSSYPQVGQRLMALHGLPIQGGAIADYMPAPAMVAVGGGHGHSSMPQHHYGLPMPIPNLRTKSDLLNIDNFLDQMQSTVYESSNAAAAAGVHLPGSHYTHQSINFRQSHSPPQTAAQHLVGSMGPQTSGAPAMMSAASSHSPLSTAPALTPPSATLSYTSGNSPVSVPGLSPSSRHGSAASASYPILPAVSNGYSSHSNTAPVSTLGTNFDNDPRRRFSGGMLQRSAGSRLDLDEMDVSETTSTPNSKDFPSDAAIDPSLASDAADSPSQSSDGGEAARDKAEEVWVENIRVIEALRKLIADRLEKGQYEEDEEDTEMTEAKDVDEAKATSDEPAKSEPEAESLYPVLRAAIDSTD